MARGVLAFAWWTDDGARQAARWSAALAGGQTWRRAHAAPGLEVWRLGGGPPVGPGPSLGSVLIGRLAAPVAEAAGDERPMALARRLLATTWGGYLLLLPDPERSMPWVLRDPSGAVDALTWRCDALAVLASGLEDLPAWCLPAALPLDWDRIADGLRRPASLTAATALAGIHTVAPGDLQPLGAGPAAARALWRPSALAAGAAPPPDTLPARLRQAVDAAVAGLAAPHPRLVCEVSGGLDSAIVATTLARRRRPAGLTLLHVFANLPESDERGWAAAGAGAVGAPMTVVEKPIEPLRKAEFEAVARGARPALNALDAGRDRLTLAVLEEVGASAILTGKGGDAVFFQTPTPLLLRDRVADGGPRELLGPFARELARWLRRSVWSTAWDAVAGGDRELWGAPSPLWGPRLRERPAGPAHPWLEGLEDLPPAKRFQIEAVTLAQVHRGATRYGAEVEVLHPLLSQPVLEAVLPIPAWRFVAGGRDRALARAAFADRAPPATLARRSKGEFSGVYSRQLALSLPMLRSLLLDGVLAAAGVLDRAAVDMALRRETLIWRADANALLAAAAVECWVRHWQGRAGGTAPASADIRCASNQARTRP